MQVLIERDPASYAFMKSKRRFDGRKGNNGQNQFPVAVPMRENVIEED